MYPYRVGCYTALRTVSDLGLRYRARSLLELFGKGHVVEKGPGVVELVVPCPLEVAHRLQHAFQLLVSYQGQQGGIDSGRVRCARRIVFGRAY